MVDRVSLEARTEADTVADRGVGGKSGSNDVAGLKCVLDLVSIGPPEDGTIAVLGVVGEIDLSTQDSAEAALGGALRAGPRYLVVDMSEVSFCWARGLTRLIDTGRNADERKIGYALCGLAPHVGRAATMSWGSDGPARYHSLTAAMATIRARHAYR